eukprot:2814193-Alexandrium_andersonii.AAC.1
MTSNAPALRATAPGRIALTGVTSWGAACTTLDLPGVFAVASPSRPSSPSFVRPGAATTAPAAPAAAAAAPRPPTHTLSPLCCRAINPPADSGDAIPEIAGIALPNSAIWRG